MGRELRRVPLKFDAVINEVWPGFINPFHIYHKSCGQCGGTGYSPEMKLMHDQWYGNAPFKPEDNGSTSLTHDNPFIKELAQRSVERAPEYYTADGTVPTHDAVVMEAMRLAKLFNSEWSHHLNQDDVDAIVAADGLWDLTRVPLKDNEKQVEDYKKIRAEGKWWLPYNNGFRPTAALVNDMSIRDSLFMAVSSQMWHCMKARATREGLKNTKCVTCKGTGTLWQSTYYKRKYDKWTPTNPPRGKGFQLWENTTEGSPQSPVFKTLHELCVWASGFSGFGSQTFTTQQWEEMLSPGGIVHSKIETERGTMVFI